MQIVKEETLPTIEQADYEIPIIARGKIINDYSLNFGGRRGSATFVTPDPKKTARETETYLG